MLSGLLVFASLLAAASASSCRPADPPTPTLPSTDANSVLPPPDRSHKLLKIAIGHGLQNYTCTSTIANVTAIGALAVLYDVTNLHPSALSSGLSAKVFNALPSMVLWSQDIPLNLQNASAADPGTKTMPNTAPESGYGAVLTDPFIAPTDLSMPNIANIPFLGHHYFDANGVPTFDLCAAGLLGSVAKTSNIPAPATADKGLLNTGAVDWLQLKDNGKGISKCISIVYRVITAGGVSEKCSQIGAPAGSVPYAAYYWFYG